MQEMTAQSYTITKRQDEAVRELAQRRTWPMSLVIRAALDDYIRKHMRELARENDDKNIAEE